VKPHTFSSRNLTEADVTVADARAGARILLVGGAFGVCAEVAWIRLGILSFFMRPESWDLALAEIASAAFTYGAMLILAVVAIRYPALALASPRRSPDTPWRRSIRDHWAMIWMVVFVLLPLATLMEQLYLLAIGLLSPQHVVSSWLHLYPIMTLWAAAFTFSRGTRALHPVPQGH
jgi:hypothetical protein